jgi:hypothetical protein
MRSFGESRSTKTSALAGVARCSRVCRRTAARASNKARPALHRRTTAIGRAGEVPLPASITVSQMVCGQLSKKLLRVILW